MEISFTDMELQIWSIHWTAMTALGGSGATSTAIAAHCRWIEVRWELLRLG